MGTTPLLFDRHLLILAPSSVLLFVLLAPARTRWEWVPFAVVMVPLGYYSLASSHDVHAESRLAFRAGNDLIADGVSPAKINGGYAFDGWHLYETHSGPVPVRPLPPWWGYRIWDDLNSSPSHVDIVLNSPEAAWWSGPVRPPGEVDYVITLSSPQNIGLQGIGPLSGVVHGGGVAATPPKFHEIRRYPFISGWRGQTKFIYVLQRITAETPRDSATTGEQP